MSNTPAQLLQKLLHGEGGTGYPNLIPVNPPITSIMEICGVYWPEAHREAELMATLASSCQEVLRFNAVNVPFDMTVEAEALGCDIIWKEGIAATPQVKEGNMPQANILDFGDELFTRGRFPVVFQALYQLHGRYGGKIPLIAFMEGPFTIAGLVFGVNRMYKSLIKNPEVIQHILHRLGGLTTSYALRLLDAGADTIIMLDPNVMGLTAQQFDQYVLPVYVRITEAITTPLILHICGNINPLLPSIGESNFAALSFDYPSVQVESVKTALGDSMKLIGSVPTITHLLDGTRDEVFSLSLSMIESGVHLLAPSCFTPPESPIENVRAMMEAIDHWNGNDGP